MPTLSPQSSPGDVQTAAEESAVAGVTRFRPFRSGRFAPTL